MDHETSFELEGLWPTRKQRLLLKAGLEEPEIARRAILTWLNEHDTTTPIDGASLRLIPLVEANLTELNFQHPIIARFATIARLTKIKSRAIVADISPVLRAFERADIPVLVLKGLHLAGAYYHAPEARPMSDADIAVPPEFAQRAHDLLSDLGYRRDYADKPLSHVRKIHHASSYSCPDKVDIDLHWRIMPLTNTPETDAPFWRDAQPWQLNGVRVKVLSPTHLLYHTIIHGVRWNPLPPLRWIGDAIVQLRRDHERIDWDDLSRLARAHRTTHRLVRGLRYLQVEFGVDAPEETLARLEARRLSLVERIENRLVVYNDDDDETDLKSKYRRLFGEHCRASLGLGPVRFVTDFLDYLILRTQGVDTRHEMVGYLLGGAGRGLKKDRMPDA